MAITYNCKECRADLNLSSERLYPSGVYFEAGNKNTISFFWIDGDRFKFDKEDKIRPFFETLDYWGFHRNRTKISCRNCGFLLGHIYDDGPPLTDAHYPFGPSQVIPRNPRMNASPSSGMSDGSQSTATVSVPKSRNIGLQLERAVQNPHKSPPVLLFFLRLPLPFSVQCIRHYSGDSSSICYVSNLQTHRCC